MLFFLHLAVVTKADGHQLGGQCKYLPLDLLPELLSKCNVKENCVGLLPMQWAHVTDLSPLQVLTMKFHSQVGSQERALFIGVGEIFSFFFYFPPFCFSHVFSPFQGPATVNATPAATGSVNKHLCRFPTSSCLSLVNDLSIKTSLRFPVWVILLPW